MFKKFFIVILTFVITICGVSCSAGKANIDDVKKSDTINTNSTLSTSKTIVVVSDETTELTSASEITTAESHSEPTTEVKSTTTRKHITTTKKAVQSTTQDAEVAFSDGKNLGKFKITVYMGLSNSNWSTFTASSNLRCRPQGNSAWKHHTYKWANFVSLRYRQCSKRKCYRYFL